MIRNDVPLVGTVKRAMTDAKMAAAGRPRARRSDAPRNHEHILHDAQAAICEHGTSASMRDIARRADVGLGTLYRHLPTRDALLEALLRHGFDRLLKRAQDSGRIQPEITGADLFAMTSALCWIADQAPSFAGSPECLFRVLWDGLARCPPPACAGNGGSP
jgi:AcrR family transcriptional regulator